MWIYKPLILKIILSLQLLSVYCKNPTYCAYKNSKFVLNATDSSDKDVFRQMIINQRHNARGVFISNGYERCDDLKSTGNCFTLWATDADRDASSIVLQGCWIHNNVLDNNCRHTKCDIDRSQSMVTSDPNVNFCCCHGNKCNEVNEEDASAAVKNVVVPTKKTAIPAQLEVVPAVEKPSESTEANSKFCAFNSPATDASGKMSPTSASDVQGLGQVIGDGKTMSCNGNKFCFSYYTLDPDDQSKLTIKFQGCWDVGDIRQSCYSSICISHRESHYTSKLGNNSHFCCCNGDMCNMNISKDIISYVRPTTESSGPKYVHLHDPSYKERTIIISLLSVFSMAIIILSVYLTYRFCFHSNHLPVVNSSTVDVPQSPQFDIEDLKISCLISKGRYSEVWKGSLNEQDVAVKIYTSNYRQYYSNEKYIYSLPHMEHPNVLRFFGGEERIAQDGNMQYLLVLQYVPDGTLMNYLKNNTIDWYTMCKLCQSLAKGLAHLHTDMGCGDTFKPTVAHRDINSRNILVKPDHSCIIADLGFCMTAMGSKLIHKNHTENAEQTSLIDVGTLRYMAPELLDGAVNLRDCEASLKQIDMYAFGLVIWEIASRCTDLYQGCPMPEFALPFQVESGTHPTFEEMQLLVSRNKTRPKFPEVWKDYNQAIRALKETIEECWDHDAEARLTALCVEERIVEMKMLWSHDNRNKGVTPTINTALLSHASHGNRPGYHGNGHTQWGGLGSTTESSSPNVVAEGSTSALIINNIRDSTISHSESVSNLPPVWVNDRSGSFSTSTMETTVGQTPTEHVTSHPKSQNINLLMNQAIPPHQGRNPIVERNTHKRSDEELAVVGNNLLYGKDRHQADCIQSPVTNFDSLTDSLETSLMQNDVLNHHRSPPISYVQNQVNTNPGNDSGSRDLPPKVVNNPSQKHDNININITSSGPAANSLSHSRLTQKNKKAKEMGLFGHLALLGRLAFGGKFEGKKNVNENDHMSHSRAENGTVYDSIGQHNPLFEPSQSLETEVRLTSNGTVTRPANLRVKQPNMSTREPSHSNLNRNIGEATSSRVSGTDHGLQNETPMFSRIRGAPYSKSTSDLSPQKTSGHSKLEEETKFSRPSTLSLKGHNYKSKGQSGSSLNSLSIFKGVPSQPFSKGLSSESKKAHSDGFRMQDKPMNTSNVGNELESTDKIKLRIKTPQSEKQGRLSLHDDRLMSDCDTKPEDETKLRKSSISLQQLKSIDETCANVYTDCTC